MDWTDSDEQLYRSLTLEQEFSAGGEAVARRVYGSAYPCTVYLTMLLKGERIQYYWKMPRHWYADPLNPWILTQLILWIPVNIVYFSFQGLRSLASARNSWSQPGENIAYLEPGQLTFSSRHYPLSGPITYARITAIGHYANGLRIDCDGTRLRLEAAASPELFVALRHLGPQARVTSGLTVPPGFVDRCSSSGRHLDVSQMAKNPPETWVSQPNTYKLQLPTQAIVGIGIIALLALIFIVNAV
jgi:hypothetical protein